MYYNNMKFAAAAIIKVSYCHMVSMIYYWKYLQDKNINQVMLFVMFCDVMFKWCILFLLKN